jgi:hypothetical protein
VGARPEHVEISGEQGADRLLGTIASTLSLPPFNTRLFTIRVGEHEVHAQTSGDQNRRAGDRVWLTFKRYHLFDRASGLRLGSHPEIP